MIEISTLHRIIVVLINIFGIGLGLVVYFKNRKKALNQTFVLMTLLMLIWIDFAFLGRFFALQSPLLALSSLKLAWFATPLFFGSLHLFITLLTNTHKRYSSLNKIIIFSGILISCLALFSNYIIRGFQLQNNSLNILYGPGIILFLGYGIILIASTIILLFKSYSQLREEEKMKVSYLFLGLFIFYGANLVFNVIFPIFLHITALYYLGDYSTIILLAFTAYAIVKRKLFGIKVVLTQLLVGFIAILLLVNIIDSRSAFEYIWKGSLFVAFLIAGTLLIKSVLNEIKRREELEKVTAQLKEANAKLRKLDRAKTEFLAIASHQLRTPLTAARGYLSMMRHGNIYGKPPAQFREPLREVYRSVLRLGRLTNRLLNVSRIDTGRLTMNVQNASLVKLISSILEEFKPQAEAKHLYLRFRKPKEKIPLLPFDPEKIRQVLVNLIDNALKYTQKGGVEVSLHLIDDRAVGIQVKDTGVGMTKEELNKVFESFSRGLAGQKFHSAGAGLGLYIAKKFVQLHQGKIWATSSGRGQGSTIWVELPLELDQAKLKKDLKSFSEGKGEKIPW